MAAVIYPTHMALSAGAEVNLHELLKSDGDPAYIRDLVNDGGLTGDFLDLLTIEPVLGVKPGPTIRSLDWLLVLCTELIRRQAALVTPDMLTRTVALLKQTHYEDQTGFCSADASSADYVKDQKRLSRSLKIVGALTAESYMAYMRRDRADMGDRSTYGPMHDLPVITTYPSEHLDKPAPDIPQSLVNTLAAFLEALCGDEPRRVDVLAPHPSSTDFVLDPVEGPWIRLKFDHTTMFRFIKHIAIRRPGGLAGSGLCAATEKLIAKLDLDGDELVREAALDAQNALTEALAAPAEPGKVPYPSSPVPSEGISDNIRLASISSTSDNTTFNTSVPAQCEDSSSPLRALEHTHASPNFHIGVTPPPPAPSSNPQADPLRQPDDAGNAFKIPSHYSWS